MKCRFSCADDVSADVGPITAGICIVLNIVRPAPIEDVRVGVDGHYETNIMPVTEGLSHNFTNYQKLSQKK